MEWRDEGIVLSVRKHGETGAIAELLTAEHGRCLGHVRGGRSRRLRPVLQPGNIVQAVWRARLEEHLGHLTVEGIDLKAGAIMEVPFRLAGLATLAGLAQLLPEREPHRRIYDATRIVLDAVENDDIWPALMVRWELGLLEELGFGLDLSKCAVSAAVTDLTHVSPKTGRAVSFAAGEPYRDRLLALPDFLKVAGAAAAPADIIDGFRLTGHFLARDVFGPRGIAAPEQRAWIIRELARKQH